MAIYIDCDGAKDEKIFAAKIEFERVPTVYL